MLYIKVGIRITTRYTMTIFVPMVKFIKQYDSFFKNPKLLLSIGMGFCPYRPDNLHPDSPIISVRGAKLNSGVLSRKFRICDAFFKDRLHTKS